MTTDITVEILREIRDGVRDLREDLSSKIEALRDDITQRLDQTNERLTNVEHGLNDLGRFMRQFALDQAKHERFHSHHVERLEDDVSDLKTRVQRLEDRAGS